MDQQIMWEIYPKARGHKSARRLREKFVQDTGIKLHAVEGRYEHGATTVWPEFPQSVLDGMAAHFDTPIKDRNIHLVTGKKGSRRAHKQRKRKTRNILLEAAANAVKDLHDPRRDLLTLLNDQSHTKISKRIEHAASELQRLAQKLPNQGNRLDTARGYLLKVIETINEDAQLIYGPSDRTHRVFAMGPNWTQLVRAFRLLALSTCGPKGRVVELDLHYCHLAVAAMKWELPKTTKLLKSGRNCWKVLLEYLGLDESYKPIIKTTIYSIIYGMGKKKLRRQFLEGKAKGFMPVKGVTDPALWRKFTRHPVVRELLKARDAQIAMLTTDQGGYDAFGEWTAVEKKPGKFHALSTMSAISQSYEQKLMYSMLGILKRNKQVYVLCYLHDGLTVCCSDTTKMDRQIKALQSAVKTCADDLGILTELEAEVLDADVLRAEAEALVSQLAA